MVERDFVTQGLCPIDEARSDIGRHRLAPAFIVGYVALGHADSGSQVRLSHTQTLANRLNGIHALILAMLFDVVNSFAGCGAQRQR
ncbi:hypothetical protein AZ20_4222 [Bordetella bronchiseptica E014]|nr:hypothetical protein AZ20_4222 [Bordetella bronchiseptica E014]